MVNSETDVQHDKRTKTTSLSSVFLRRGIIVMHVVNALRLEVYKMSVCLVVAFQIKNAFDHLIFGAKHNTWRL